MDENCLLELLKKCCCKCQHRSNDNTCCSGKYLANEHGYCEDFTTANSEK